ncbi:prolyl oligopeptidase family serine peptidase [Angustibacter sp. McL0619]|uniref:S9 family peptidase n=1 Tax=Angustibacter sp. McL0619 TaxID=3415676 RepID=UPI003CE85BDB
MTQLPDWEARFRARRVGMPDFARDAEDRTVVAATTSGGTIELHWWSVGDDEPAPATDRPEGTAHGTLDPSGDHLWWFDDRKGDERGVWRRQPYGSAPGQATDATGLPAAYSAGLALGRGVAVVASTDEEYGVRVHAIGTDGSPRLLYEHVEEAYVGDLSRDESLVVLAHSEHGDSRHPALRVLRVADATVVADLWDGPGKGLDAIAFSPVAGDPRLVVTHERDGVPALLVWDPTTGTEQRVDVALPGEVEDADWWPDARSVVVAMSHQARTTLARVELDSLAVQRFGPTAGTVRSMAVRADGEVWASWSSAATPTSVRRLNVARQDEGEVVLAAPGPAAPGSVAVEDVWVDGAGGRVHALLRRPVPSLGPQPDGPLPLVVEVHGGPTHHDVDAFGPYPSAWVDHGFAVVQVNYRGSTGYGSAWRDALEERVGHVELEDVLAVRDHLVATGIADPTRVVLAGASWGGFLTLLGLGTQPGSWALGLAGVPVADYVAAYEDEMEGLKAFDRSLFGGSPEQVPQRYADSSPISYVDAVDVPVLVLAGENDPRCPIRQIENYLVRLAERGVPHQVYRYDAGHGSMVDDERVRQMRVELDFALEHLQV